MAMGNSVSLQLETLMSSCSPRLEQIRVRLSYKIMDCVEVCSGSATVAFIGKGHWPPFTKWGIRAWEC